jgi:hypothetical protein
MIVLFLALVTLPLTAKLFTYRLPPVEDNVATDNATSDRMGRIIHEAQKGFKIENSWGY